MSKGAKLTNGFPESLIVKIWQCQLPDRTDLITEDGEPIKIVYPGRLNDDRGADLLDAVIATRQGLLKGDIEVHIKSSNWQSHRHHRDPHYNQVILHVVFWRDVEAVTCLQNGKRVPTLALCKYIKSPTCYWNNFIRTSADLSLPYQGTAECSNAGFIGKFLDKAGEKRFAAKASGFQADIVKTGAGQSLYQGIMTGLGYAKNKLPFLELARRVPLQTLQEVITQDKISAEECLIRQQALLLGTAGLLLSQRSDWHPVSKSNDKCTDRLEKIWASFRQSDTMSENDWHLFKVRPNNLPARRIAAISHLMLHYKERGLLKEIIDKIREAPIETGHHELEKALLVTTNGYWANHFGPGLPGRITIPALIGESRAADIAVNVLLPFTFAWGKLTSQPGLARKALDLYHHYPRLAINALEKHMRNQFRLSSDSVDSAQRQQGLIHIYKTLCSQGRCHQCPMSHHKCSVT